MVRKYLAAGFLCYAIIFLQGLRWLLFVFLHLFNWR
nr:MAG TPA: hypothetical protein [Caudoviricetes sp.]